LVLIVQILLIVHRLLDVVVLRLVLQQVDWNWLTDVVHVLDARNQWKHDLRIVGPVTHVHIVVEHRIGNISASICFSIFNAAIGTILIHLLVSIEVKGRPGCSVLHQVVLLVYLLVILLREQVVNRFCIEYFTS
jgi:hypothetical protein